MKYGGYEMFDSANYQLIRLGNIVLFKSNKKYESYCRRDSTVFNYNGIQNALFGNDDNYDEHNSHDHFIPKRIFVIQMI